MRAWIAFVVALGWATGAWAVEGALIPGSHHAAGDFRSQAFYLCDERDSGDSACGEFDLRNGTMGWPHHYVIEINATTGCSATPEVIPRVRWETGGTSHDLVTTSLTPTGTSAQVFDWPSHPILDAGLVGDLTGCTDIEVILRLFYSR